AGGPLPGHCRFVWCICAKLPFQAGDDRGSLPRRRLERRGGPRTCSDNDRDPGPACRRRQQARRHRRDRRHSGKNAAPDGYTLLVSSLAVFVVNPHLQKNLQYDPLKDFDLITVAVQAPNVLVCNPAFEPSSVQDLIAYEKKNPGKLTFASS